MTDKQLIIILGVAAFGIWYAKKKAGDVVAAVNPVNQENIFHTGVNKIGSALSNNPDFSLGSWVYDIFNPDEAETK